MDDYRLKSPDAGRLGKAVEHLVAASCIIGSRGLLNVSTALIDDEGVDLVFHRRNGAATLAVQVKSRMSDSKALQRGLFRQDVRTQTFRPRADLHFLFAAVNLEIGSLDTVWFVPSIVLHDALRPNNQSRLLFTASLKPRSNDRWRQFRFSPSELPSRILRELDHLEKNRTRGEPTRADCSGRKVGGADCSPWSSVDSLIRPAARAQGERPGVLSIEREILSALVSDDEVLAARTRARWRPHLD